MTKKEYQEVINRNKTQELQFELTEMNAMPCYIAEPYKVIEYGDWYAFYRIHHKKSNTMMFGNSIERSSLDKSTTYTTKEEAFEACQKHNIAANKK